MKFQRFWLKLRGWREGGGVFVFGLLREVWGFASGSANFVKVLILRDFRDYYNWWV